jgi:ABC-type sugar transport system ATPase subunit
VLVRVRGLACPPRLKPVDLDLRAGEVVAIFGLVGAGRTRLGRTLFGLEAGAVGDIEVDGKPVRITSPVDAIAAGLGYVGEDRALGLVPTMSVAGNITLASLGRLGRGPLLDSERERALARRYVDELGIRTASLDHPVATLSGGNQQKVVLARWLCSGARVLVLDDPTRGIDVGAKEEVFRLVRRLAADGIAILYLTSELKEARALADRILVMARGRVVRSASPDEPDDEIVGAAAGGSDG